MARIQKVVAAVEITPVALIVAVITRVVRLAVIRAAAQVPADLTIVAAAAADRAVQDLRGVVLPEGLDLQAPVEAEATMMMTTMTTTMMTTMMTTMINA